MQRRHSADVALRPPARRGIILVVGALALCGLTGCSTWWTASSSQASSVPRAAGTRLTFVAGASRARQSIDNVVSVLPTGAGLAAVTRGAPSVTDAAWSATTGDLVYARRWVTIGPGDINVGHYGVFVLRPDGTTRLIRRCGVTCGASSFAWSPDGRQIAFVTYIHSRFTGTAGEIAAMNADGSGFRVICTEATCGQGLDDPQWSPDGSKLLFSNQGVAMFPSLGLLPSGIWVANTDGSGIRKLTQPGCRPGTPVLAGCAYDSDGKWSSDGRWIAFSRHSSIPIHGAPRSDVELMSPDGSHLHSIYTCTGILCNQVKPPIWSPNGSTIAVAPWVERRSQLVLLTPGGSRRVIHTCMGTQCVTPSDVAWSPDGKRLGFFSSARDADAYVIDANGNDMRRIGLHAECCLTWIR